MSRRRHPNKDIEEAVRYAETHGWLVKITTGHAWGKYVALKTLKSAVAEFFV